MTTRARDYRDLAIHDALSYRSVESLTGRHRIVRELVTPVPTDRVLEVGCTIGYFVNLYLRHHAQSVDAIDIDPGDIARARADAAAAPTPIMPTFRVGNAEALPYRDNAFSLVYCMDVLEHVEHPEGAARELIRVTAPGGRIVITVPGHWFGNRLDRHYPDHRHYSLRAIEALFPNMRRVTWHQTGLLWAAAWGVAGGVGRRVCKLLPARQRSRAVTAASAFADRMADLDLRLHYGTGSALTVIFEHQI